MTVDEIRIRVQEMLPKHMALRGILGATKWTVERIRGKGEWSFDLSRAAVDLVASYSTGTVAVTNGGTTVTGTGTTFTSAMAGRKMRFGGGPEYKIATFTDTTHVELSATFLETTVTASGFVIYQNEYALTSGVATVRRIWDTTNQRVLRVRDAGAIRNKDISRTTSGRTQEYAELGRDGAGDIVLYVWPHPGDAARLEYWYETEQSEVTSVSSVVDVPNHLDEMVIQGVYARMQQILKINGWRDEKNDFFSMMDDRWAKDKPMRDAVICPERADHQISGVLFLPITDRSKRIVSS